MFLQQTQTDDKGQEESFAGDRNVYHLHFSDSFTWE